MYASVFASLCFYLCYSTILCVSFLTTCVKVQILSSDLNTEQLHVDTAMPRSNPEIGLSLMSYQEKSFIQRSAYSDKSIIQRSVYSEKCFIERSVLSTAMIYLDDHVVDHNYTRSSIT